MAVATITHSVDGVRITIDGREFRYGNQVDLAESYAATLIQSFEDQRELSKARSQLQCISRALADEKIDEYRALKGRIDAILSDIPF